MGREQPSWEDIEGKVAVGSRPWAAALTSDLSHPFRASEASLGLWVILGRQDFLSRHRLFDQLL